MKIVFFLFLSFLMITSHASSVFYTKGNVEIIRGSNHIKAMKGSPLKNGDVLSTGKNSIAIILYREKSKIKLDSNTSLKIKDYYQNGNEKKKRSFLSLVRGSMMMNFKKDRRLREVNIRVKQVAVGVRGTKFLVSSSNAEDRNSYVAVKNGRVKVFNFKENDYENIRGGNAIVVENGSKLTKPYKFKWVENLNWDLNTNFSNSIFNSRDFISMREKELQSVLDTLRLRKKKRISSSILRKWKTIQGDSIKFKSPIKKLKRKIKQRRDRVKKEVKSKTIDKINPRKNKDKLIKKTLDGFDIP